MKECEVTVLNQLQRVLEHRLGLGREARDDVGAEDDTGPEAASVLAKPDRVVTQVAALHALQDHVVASLKAEMQMRHETRFGRDGLHQIVVRLDGIDRGNPEPRQIGNQPQDAHDQIAKPRRARQVGPPGGQIDTGQDDFQKSAVNKPLDLIHDDARRNRPRIAPAIGNDAEGAAVVAAILDLDIGAVTAETVDQVACRFLD